MQLWPWPLRVSGKCSYLGASLYLPLSQNKREEGEQNKYKNEGMGKEKRNNQDLRSNWAGTNTFSEGMNSTNTEGTAKDRGNQPSFQGVCCKEPQLMCYSQTGPAKIPTLHFLMQKHTHTHWNVVGLKLIHNGITTQHTWITPEVPALIIITCTCFCLKMKDMFSDSIVQERIKTTLFYFVSLLLPVYGVFGWYYLGCINSSTLV